MAKALVKSLTLVITLAFVSCGVITPEDVQKLIEHCKNCVKTPKPEVTPVPTEIPSPQPTLVPTAIPTKLPTIAPSPTPATGYACSGIQDSRQHLLYKPVSDTSGNAVVVFDGKYKTLFDSVKLELKDGKLEELFWKPLEPWGNPDSVGPRQHWRSRSKCQSVKNQAKIISTLNGKSCTYVLPGDSCKRWE